MRFFRDYSINTISVTLTPRRTPVNFNIELFFWTFGEVSVQTKMAKIGVAYIVLFFFNSHPVYF